jgi:PAS domain S-box-containing protein
VPGLLDSASVAMLAVDGAGVIRDANACALERLGRSAGQVIGQSMDMVGASAGTVVIYAIPGDGSSLETIEHLKAAQKITQCGSWEVDVVDLENRNLNPIVFSEEARRILAFPPGIRPTRDLFFAAIHPDERERCVKAMDDLLYERGPYSIDVRIPRQGGEVRIAHLQAEAVRDATGLPIRIIGTIQDVTAPRAAANALAASRSQLQALIDHAPDWIMHVDRDGIALWANRVAPGLRLDQVVGAHWLTHVEATTRDRMAAVFAEVVATGKPASIEVPHTMRTGQHTWLWCHLGPILDADGRVVGVIMVARDVTQRREIEQQLTIADRMASVGTMAAGVAHEINNPLASVIGNLDLVTRKLAALGGGEVEQVRDELRDAAQAAERVREIVRDLTMFSAAEDERRTPVDVRRVLETTLRMAGAEIRARAVIVRELADVPRVEANEARLGQVFLHLLLNAAQAIPEGNPERHSIKVTTGVEGGRVVITVSDTGVGIAPEARARIFTPFFTTKPIGVGTGLGLSICHRIVTALGGEIDFRSELGKGSDFRVALPVSSTAPAEPPRRRQSSPPPRRGRVLVIDDEPLITRTIRRILGTDHDVTIAENGEVGLAALGAGVTFDVILCDLMMPVMSGMDLHAELARTAPATAQRMVFMTGGAFTARARSFLDAVDNLRLDKPFDASSLRALVNGLIQ